MGDDYETNCREAEMIEAKIPKVVVSSDTSRFRCGAQLGRIVGVQWRGGSQQEGATTETTLCPNLETYVVNVVNVVSEEDHPPGGAPGKRTAIATRGRLLHLPGQQNGLSYCTDG